MTKEICCKQSDPAELGISMEVRPIALSTIDVSNSKFGAFYRIILRFQAEPDCLDIQSFKVVADRTYYDPELFADYLPFSAVDIPNALELEETPTFFYGEDNPKRYLLFREDGQPADWFTAEIKIKGHFKHLFDLRRFPFDEQKLRVRHVIFRNNQADFRRRWSAMISDSENIDKEMLALSDYAIRYATVETVLEEPMTVDMLINISRRPWFYTIKSTVSLVIIVFLALLTFRLPIEAMPDRLAIVGSLVIATIAIKFVTAADVPRVPYTTRIDRETLATLFFLFICSAIHGAIGIESANHWGSIVAFVIGGALISFFLIRPIKHSWRRRRQRRTDPLFVPPFR